MTKLQILANNKSYFFNHVEELINELNSDDAFLKQLEDVFKIMYHRYYNDEPTPELKELIESRTDNEYINSFIQDTFREWISSNILPLHIETIENTFVKGVKFPKLNKCHKFLEYYMQLINNDVDLCEVKINKVVVLYNRDFEKFVDSFLSGYDFLTEGGTGTHLQVGPEYLNDEGYFNDKFYQNKELVNEVMANSYRETQLIQDLKGNCVIVDTQGYNYSRYVGFISSENAFLKPLDIQTPLTDEFIKIRLEGERQRAAEIEDAYYRAYCD